MPVIKNNKNKEPRGTIWWNIRSSKGKGFTVKIYKEDHPYNHSLGPLAFEIEELKTGSSGYNSAYEAYKAAEEIING